MARPWPAPGARLRPASARGSVHGLRAASTTAEPPPQRNQPGMTDIPARAGPGATTDKDTRWIWD